MNETDAPVLLDARGLLCPLPVIRTQDHVRALPDGAELTIQATDPGVMQDIPAWCRVHGHILVSAVREGRLCTLKVKVVKTETMQKITAEDDIGVEREEAGGLEAEREQQEEEEREQEKGGGQHK